MALSKEVDFDYEADKASLRLIEAQESHLTVILAFSKGIYEGRDYFKHVYPEWLAQEKR